METGSQASFSIPSIIALIAALMSFFVGALGGVVLALIGFAFGMIGFLLSLSPSRRGGIVSILSMGIAMIAMVAAGVKAVAWFF
jgi:hypothetical protein